MDMNSSNDSSKLRVLVAIATYGRSNDRYLDRIIREYRSMAFAVDIVLLSNIDKSVPESNVSSGFRPKIRGRFRSRIKNCSQTAVIAMTCSSIRKMTS